MFRSNAAKEDMNQLQKYFRIILLVWVDNFFLLPEMIWEKSWESFHPTAYAATYIMESNFFNAIVDIKAKQ